MKRKYNSKLILDDTDVDTVLGLVRTESGLHTNLRETLKDSYNNGGCSTLQVQPEWIPWKECCNTCIEELLAISGKMIEKVHEEKIIDAEYTFAMSQLPKKRKLEEHQFVVDKKLAIKLLKEKRNKAHDELCHFAGAFQQKILFFSGQARSYLLRL